VKKWPVGPCQGRAARHGHHAEGAAWSVGERAPTSEQDLVVAATGGARREHGTRAGGQYGGAPGRGPARWEKEVGSAQLNSIVSDLN
jgi:hypothetical protein